MSLAALQHSSPHATLAGCCHETFCQHQMGCSCGQVEQVAGGRSNCVGHRGVRLRLPPPGQDASQVDQQCGAITCLRPAHADRADSACKLWEDGKVCSHPNSSSTLHWPSSQQQAQPSLASQSLS